MKKLKKTVHILCSILWYLAVGALSLVLVTVISAKLQGKVPRILGYSVLRIISGSMEPEIPTGSYILVEKAAPEEIHKGDIISFYSDDPLILGCPNTHRVDEEPVHTAEGICYITKGDANLVQDPVPAASQNLIGRYVCSLNGLARAAEFCTTREMMILIITIPVVGSVFMGIAAQSLRKRSKADDIQEEEHETEDK